MTTNREPAAGTTRSAWLDRLADFELGHVTPLLLVDEIMASIRVAVSQSDVADRDAWKLRAVLAEKRIAAVEAALERATNDGRMNHWGVIYAVEEALA